MSFIKRWKKIILSLKDMDSRVQKLEMNQENVFLKLNQPSNEYVGSRQLMRSEFSIYSQNGEDGILAHIFSKIRTTNKKFVEFGIGNGTQCNTANLSLNYGWEGLLIEGDGKQVELAKYFYQNHPKIQSQDKVQILNAFIDKDNINDLINKAGLPKEIDLLSVDVDGNDYWIWEAITVVSPRVVVVEYNALFGERSITVPYDPLFQRYDKHPSGQYFGASVKALESLGRQKGYSLIGCDSTGVNAFFVRDDIVRLHPELTVVDAGEAYFPQRKRLIKGNNEHFWNQISNLDYVEI